MSVVVARTSFRLLDTWKRVVHLSTPSPTATIERHRLCTAAVRRQLAARMLLSLAIGATASIIISWGWCALWMPAVVVRDIGMLVGEDHSRTGTAFVLVGDSYEGRYASLRLQERLDAQWTLSMSVERRILIEWSPWSPAETARMSAWLTEREPVAVPWEACVESPGWVHVGDTNRDVSLAWPTACRVWIRSFACAACGLLIRNLITIPQLHRRTRPRFELCYRCGYDMHQLDRQCPECGSYKPGAVGGLAGR